MSRVNPWKITGYKAGQNVICKVSHAEPGGYAVIIPKDNLPGFLPTELPYKAGEEVLAQYVCVSNSRILLQCRFGGSTKPGAPRHDTVKWEDQLDQIDGKSGAKIDYHRPSEQPQGVNAADVYQENQQAAHAQEFDQDPSGQQYQYGAEQYAESYADGQGQPVDGQYPQGQYDQAQYGQSQYDQAQYAQAQLDPAQHGQTQYDQTQYDQSQYDQTQYDQAQSGQGQYAQAQHGQQNDFANQQYAQDYSQPNQSGQYQSGQYQTGAHQSAQAHDQNSQYQNAQPSQNQNYNNNGAQPQGMQFSPQQGQTGQAVSQQSGFAAQQNGGMQFKPSMPVDFADTQNQWNNGAPPQGGVAQVPGQNSYPAPVQPPAQYQSVQQAPPVSYQGPNTGSAAPYQPQVQSSAAGGYQAAPPAVAGQYQQNASGGQGQYDSGTQASASGTAYQSPASYQGPSQAQPLPPYAPVIVPSVEPVAPAPVIKPTDDWGYAGQGWDDGGRLTAPAAVPTAAPLIPAVVPASEADAAFRVWAPNSPTREFHLKRATDLVPPAFDLSSLATFTAEEQDLEWLITDIEGGMRTGCVKAVSEATMSRSAALLYKGRAVGCIYGRKQQPENYGTEQSLQIMMQDLEKPDTTVQLYDLPDSVVLPMSALFLGYPVPREENVDARTYMDYMCNWFESKSQTACLAITFPSRSATSLCFIHEGKFCGAFYVEEQKFSEDKEFVYNLMKNDPQASVEASILPPEMTSSAVRFGFNLSMARKKVY